MNQASWALSYLISGVLFWGGVAWLGDHLLHTRFLTPIGIVLGAGLGCYLIVKRFGQPPQDPGAEPPTTPSGSKGRTDQ